MTIDLKNLRAITKALSESWEQRSMSDTNWTCWNGDYAEKQIPPVLEALEQFVKVAKAIRDDPASIKVVGR